MGGSTRPASAGQARARPGDRPVGEDVEVEHAVERLVAQRRAVEQHRGGGLAGTRRELGGERRRPAARTARASSASSSAASSPGAALMSAPRATTAACRGVAPAPPAARRRAWTASEAAVQTATATMPRSGRPTRIDDGEQQQVGIAPRRDEAKAAVEALPDVHLDPEAGDEHAFLDPLQDIAGDDDGRAPAPAAPAAKPAAGRPTIQAHHQNGGWIRSMQMVVVVAEAASSAA